MSTIATPLGRLSGLGVRPLGEGDDRIVVVGAGGWLGLATTELLALLLGEAFERRVVLFGSQDRELDLRGGLSVRQRPLSQLAELGAHPTWVLHLAFLTKDRAEQMAPDDYVAANRAISGQVLEALPRIGARRVFLPSSGAVYSAEDPAASDAMRLYGRLKHDDELLFSGWAEREGGRAVIVRVFNIAGPYINKVQSYALAAFILDALKGEAIRIKARRRVYRSYVAIRELMSVVFGLLAEDEPGVVRFDTAGEEPLEMGQIAEAVRDALGLAIPIERPPVGDDPPDVYVGDAAPYADLRRNRGVEAVAFLDQVRETAAYLAASPADA